MVVPSSGISDTETGHLPTSQNSGCHEHKDTVI